MVFRPAASRGGWIGLAVCILVWGIWLAMAFRMYRLGPSPMAASLGMLMLFSLPILALLSFWTLSFFRLHYRLTRDAVFIRWGFDEQVIPMQDVREISTGRPYASPLKGLRWPGFEHGQTQIETKAGKEEPVLVYATRPPSEQILVHTAGLSYAISPEDPSAFVEDFLRRKRLGTVTELQSETQRGWFHRLSLLGDRTSLGLLAAALVCNALAFACIAWQYPELGESLVQRFRYDQQFQVAVSEAPQAPEKLWIFPWIGSLVWLINIVLAGLVHAPARLGARLLLASNLLLQLLVVFILVALLW